MALPIPVPRVTIKDQASLTLAGAESHLRYAGGIRIIAEQERTACLPTQMFLGSVADPAVVDVGGAVGFARFHDSREGAADGPAPIKVLDQRTYDLDDSVRCGGLWCVDAPPLGQQQTAFRVDGRSLDTRAADVDAEDFHHPSCLLQGRGQQYSSQRLATQDWLRLCCGQ